jgi:hypothetical protein
MKHCRFLSDGFEDNGHQRFEYTFYQYKDIRSVFVTNNDSHVGLFLNKEKFPKELVCETRKEALELAQEIRQQMALWLNRDAAKREDARAERAGILVELRKLTERIAFEPPETFCARSGGHKDLGSEEALEAVERCKKRARDGDV